MPAVAYTVDNDSAFLSNLSTTLGQAGLAVKVFESSEEFLRGDRSDDPSCLVLDAGSPDLDGLRLQSLLAERHDPIPIVFVSKPGPVSTPVTALRNGAIDFLEKPVSPPMLLNSITEALARDQHRRETEQQKIAITHKFESLTPREREVMALVVADKSSKHIARELDISPRTVEHHRAHIMQKMGARSLNDLVIMGVICGIRELRI